MGAYQRRTDSTHGKPPRARTLQGCRDTRRQADRAEPETRFLRNRRTAGTRGCHHRMARSITTPPRAGLGEQRQQRRRNSKHQQPTQRPPVRTAARGLPERLTEAVRLSAITLTRKNPARQAILPTFTTSQRQQLLVGIDAIAHPGRQRSGSQHVVGIAQPGRIPPLCETRLLELLRRTPAGRGETWQAGRDHADYSERRRGPRCQNGLRSLWPAAPARSGPGAVGSARCTQKGTAASRSPATAWAGGSRCRWAISSPIWPTETSDLKLTPLIFRICGDS